MRQTVLRLLPVLALVACKPLDRHYDKETYIADLREGSADSIDVNSFTKALVDNEIHGVDNNQFTYTELIAQGQELVKEERVRMVIDSVYHVVDSTRAARGLKSIR